MIRKELELVNGRLYYTVIIEGVKYIQMEALDDVQSARVYNPSAGYQIFTKVDFLIANGRELSSIKPDDIVGVNANTSSTLLWNMRRLSVDKEGSVNTKKLLKRVRDAGCLRLLEKLMP